MSSIDSSGLSDIIFISESIREQYGSEFRDRIVKSIYNRADEVAKKVVKNNSEKKKDVDKKIDDILTSKTFGIPLMLLLLAIVFWITLVGANYPSELIGKFLFWIQDNLTDLFMNMGAPSWLHGVIVLGFYRTLAWVVSVMLPPMAIFFPIFTLLEDLGYLPRIAFNLDHLFKKACAHGKQALTMCMGFGCNAAGVIACRIIESPRERLIAILTNNFVPCNGRFPTLIAIASIFIGGAAASAYGSVIASLAVVGLVILGIAITLLVSYLLSKTLLKGVPSFFILELPPYRKPQIGRIIYTSIIDRTIFVLGRAVAVAAPAGALTYILGNIYINGMSIIAHAAHFLQPLGHALGMDGFILMAFILGFPANEIVLPILIMSYLSAGSMVDFSGLDMLKKILVDHGWTYLTALNVMLFSLLHFPCGTTIWTIKKETGSLKWTVLSAIIPTIVAVIVCFIVTQVARMFGFA